MLALHVTSCGTQEEKIRWAFRMYDIDKNGMIDINELKRWATAFKPEKPERTNAFWTRPKLLRFLQHFVESWVYERRVCWNYYTTQFKNITLKTFKLSHKIKLVAEVLRTKTERVKKSQHHLRWVLATVPTTTHFNNSWKPIIEIEVLDYWTPILLSKSKQLSCRCIKVQVKVIFFSLEFPFGLDFVGKCWISCDLWCSNCILHHLSIHSPTANVRTKAQLEEI